MQQIDYICCMSFFLWVVLKDLGIIAEIMQRNIAENSDNI